MKKYIFLFFFTSHNFFFLTFSYFFNSYCCHLHLLAAQHRSNTNLKSIKMSFSSTNWSLFNFLVPYKKFCWNTKSKKILLEQRDKKWKKQKWFCMKIYILRFLNFFSTPFFMNVFCFCDCAFRLEWCLFMCMCSFSSKHKDGAAKRKCRKYNNKMNVLVNENATSMVVLVWQKSFLHFLNFSPQKLFW